MLCSVRLGVGGTAACRRMGRDALLLYAQYLSERRMGKTEIVRGKTCQTFELIVGDYDHDFWLKNVAGLEHEKEGGLRCHACFKTLLSATAQKAEELGFEHFATTLTISPHKNSAVIQAIGEQFKGYTHYDFKKKDGYKRSIELSKELDLYRQCYCACEFSMNKNGKEVQK